MHKSQTYSYELTISIVICIQHDEDILEHRNDDEGIDDERQDAQQVVVVLDAIREGAGVDIERRRPNVSVDDADALEGKMQRPGPALEGKLQSGVLFHSIWQPEVYITFMTNRFRLQEEHTSEPWCLPLETFSASPKSESWRLRLSRLADSPPPPGLSTSSDISDLRTPRRPFFKMLGSWECQALNRTKLMPASSKSQEFRW